MSVGGGAEGAEQLGSSGDGEMYCVKWPDFKAQLAKGVRNLFVEREDAGDTDVTLVAEGKCIQCHKLVLSLCSPYFKNIFRANQKYMNKSNTVVIVNDDIKFEDLERLVHFMYHGEVKVATLDEISGFMKAGELWKVEGLKRSTENRDEEKSPPNSPETQKSSFTGVEKPTASSSSSTASYQPKRLRKRISSEPEAASVGTSRPPADSPKSKARQSPPTKETSAICSKRRRQEEEDDFSEASSDCSSKTTKIGTGTKRLRVAELGASSSRGRSQRDPSSAITTSDSSVNLQDLLYPEATFEIGTRGVEGRRIEVIVMKMEAPEIDNTHDSSNIESAGLGEGISQSVGIREETAIAAAKGLRPTPRVSVVLKKTATVPKTRDAPKPKMEIVLTPSRDFNVRDNTTDRTLACVWDFFSYEQSGNKSVCGFCERKLKGRKISSIKKHLENVHQTDLRKRLFPSLQID